LKDGGFDFTFKRVDTQETFLKEIQSFRPSVILSDHGLPAFDGFAALAIAQSKVPDVPFIFEEPTADYQTVTIQGQVSYRVADPKKLAGLLNFTLTPNGSSYVSDDPDKLPQRVINLVHVLARSELQKLTLKEATRASEVIVQGVRRQLAASPEIASLGLEVLGLSVLAIKPTPETARALDEHAAGIGSPGAKQPTRSWHISCSDVGGPRGFVAGLESPHARSLLPAHRAAPAAVLRP